MISLEIHPGVICVLISRAFWSPKRRFCATYCPIEAVLSLLSSASGKRFTNRGRLNETRRQSTHSDEVPATTPLKPFWTLPKGTCVKVRDAKKAGDIVA